MTVKKIVHQHNNPIVDQTEVANLIYPAPAQPFLKTEQFCHNHATFPTIFGCYNGYCALKFKPFQGVKNSLESGERPCIMLFIRVRHQSCSLPTRSNWVTTKRERCLSWEASIPASVFLGERYNISMAFYLEIGISIFLQNKHVHCFVLFSSKTL